MTLYIDQRPRVWSKTDNPANGVIRVTFKDITLSMSLTEASWLAANIGREIRKVEHEHPEVCGTIASYSIKRGDIVTVRDDYGHESDYEVKNAPWELGGGRWVVGLKGISGGYSLDRVVKIVRYAEQKDSPCAT